MTEALPVQLALRLADEGVPHAVVGSTARWLREGGLPPHDLDVVVRPGDLGLLRRALAPVALPGPALRRPLDQRVRTVLGPLDLFFHEPWGSAVEVPVDGRVLQVRCG